jgi:hypothetical protein
MIESAIANAEDTIDLLLDLKHDLGKYICMPLAMLPTDAAPEEIRRALRCALVETRKAGAGTRSAADIWQTFLVEAPQSLTEMPLFADLARCVNDALPLRVFAEGDAPLPDRQELLAVLQEIAVVIQKLIEELIDDA